MRKLLMWAYLIAATLNLMGGLAPYLDAPILPLLQYLSILWLPMLGVHVWVLYFCNKEYKLLRIIALPLVFLCIWIGQKEIRWRKKEILTENSLKICNYNVQNFRFTRKGLSNTIDLLKNINADVVCLQEMRLDLLHPEQNDRITRQTEKYIAEELGMPYHRFVAYGTHIVGVAYFSRYPIVKFDTCFMHKKILNSGIIAMIETPQGKVGVANLHLTSYNVQEAIQYKNTGLGKLWAFALRSQKVLMAQTELADKSNDKFTEYPYPLVVTGDMNALPHSNVMYRIAKGLKDSFAEAGEGSGITFPIGLYGIRIDHQLHNDKITPLSVKIIPSNCSDHYPTVGVYKIK